MALFVFKNRYRAVNRAKKGQSSTLPKYFNFKKGDEYNGESYEPTTIAGVRFSKPMVVIEGAYIVPKDFVDEKQESFIGTESHTTAGYDQTQIAASQDAVSTDTATPSAGDAFDAPITTTSKAKNIGKGALIGGGLGFGAAYLFKKNLWIGAIVGVVVGGASVAIYNKIKSNQVNS